MSDYADLLSVQDDLHDGFFGETFVMSPVAEKAGDPNARRVTNATLPDATFTGIWTDLHLKALYAHNEAGHADSVTRRLSPNRHLVDFQTAAIPFPAQRGYVVTRQADGSRYEVADIVPDGMTRTTIALTATTKAKS